MSKRDDLCRNYERFVSLPWPDHLAGAQRVWFAVYDRMDERRLRARLGEFQIATGRAGHKWHLCDLTDIFADWMASQEYRESYFEDPESLESAMPEFLEFTAGRLRAELDQADSTTVVAVLGAATLFGFVRVSELMDAIKDAITGRLLVFFPGEYEANNYRLLDAQDTTVLPNTDGPTDGNVHPTGAPACGTLTRRPISEGSTLTCPSLCTIATCRIGDRKEQPIS